MLEELFQLSNSTASRGLALTRGTVLEDFLLSKSIKSQNRSTLDKSHRSTLNRSSLNKSHGAALIQSGGNPPYPNDSFSQSKFSKRSLHDTLNQR